jgi:hypothetical protein
LHLDFVIVLPTAKTGFLPFRWGSTVPGCAL